MSVIGKCLTMCPAKEFHFRKKHNLLHKLEMSNQHGEGCKRIVNLDFCVKEFRRSAAGEVICNPDDLRPGHVLLHTIDYLFSTVLHMSDAFVNIYNFIFDRLRSVRQDATIQQFENTDPLMQIKILEKCIHFYLYAAYRIEINCKLNIDVHINKMHILDCMKSLVKLYSSIAQENQRSPAYNLNLLASYVLLNLDSCDVVMEILNNFPKSLRELEPLRTALDMYFTYRCKNYIRFHKLTRKLLRDKMFCCLFALATIIHKLRAESIKMLCHSHHSKASSFPAGDLCFWLMLDCDKNVVAYCTQLGLKIVNVTNIEFQKSSFTECTIHGHVDGCYIFNELSSLSGLKLSSYLNGSQTTAQ